MFSIRLQNHRFEHICPRFPLKIIDWRTYVLDSSLKNIDWRTYVLDSWVSASHILLLARARSQARDLTSKEENWVRQIRSATAGDQQAGDNQTGDPDVPGEQVSSDDDIVSRIVINSDGESLFDSDSD